VRTCQCGEPEDGGQYGWFDHPVDGLRCNACGKSPIAQARRAAYVIDTDKPTEGPWRVTAFGNRYASATLADGRKVFVGIERNKRIRIPFKPRGTYGWSYVGFVNDAQGRCLASADVNGTLGVRGLLKMAGLL